MEKPKKILNYNMTLNQLLINPTGPYSSLFSRRDRIITELEDRFQKILSRVKGKIEYKIYKVDKHYLFHLKVPSETLEDLFYDVCIEFYPPDELTENDNSLISYNIKLFSNALNFTFTYTYVMNQFNLLIDALKEKCNDKALKQPPRVRNPIESLGFEKSCYFAALYIKENRLLNKAEIDKILAIWDRKSFLAKIKTDNSKILEYNKLKKRLQEEKKADRKKMAKKIVKKKPK
jgi:hypothetical protein